MSRIIISLFTPPYNFFQLQYYIARYLKKLRLTPPENMYLHCYKWMGFVLSFLFHPRPTPTNKMICIDTKATYSGSLRMGLQNFSLRIPTSTTAYNSGNFEKTHSVLDFHQKFAKIIGSNLSKEGVFIFTKPSAAV